MCGIRIGRTQCEPGQLRFHVRANMLSWILNTDSFSIRKIQRPEGISSRRGSFNNGLQAEANTACWRKGELKGKAQPKAWTSG